MVDKASWHVGFGVAKGAKEGGAMKVLVCGGRRYKNKAAVFARLSRLHEETPITHLIHGDATGADDMADWWALERGVQVVRCPPNWEIHKKAGGPIRNARMLALQPDMVVAFPGGAGTTSMVNLAMAAGVKVVMGVDDSAHD